METSTKTLNLNKIRRPLNIEIKGPYSYEPAAFTDKDYYKLDLEVKLSTGINLQRPLVWTDKQKQELIFSILKGIEIPPIYAVLYTDDSIKNNRVKEFKIIDGKQRLSTIISFLNNEFKIEFENNKYLFSDLDEKAKHEIKNLHLRVYTHYAYQDNYPSDKDLIEWFEQINFSGTSQDIKHLENLKNNI